MERYGFVYIWFDRKHKRYYVGCRWGTVDDGYICSSPWMKQAYKRRPQDFKRRILAKIYTTRIDLLDEEYRYLAMMKIEELGKRYYNLRNHYHGHWSSNKETRDIVSKKLKARIISPETGIKISESLKKLPPKSEETRKKLSVAAKRHMTSPKGQEQFKRMKSNPETKLKAAIGISKAKKGISFSEEHKRKLSIAKIAFYKGVNS